MVLLIGWIGGTYSIEFSKIIAKKIFSKKRYAIALDVQIWKQFIAYKFDGFFDWIFVKKISGQKQVSQENNLRLDV